MRFEIDGEAREGAFNLGTLMLYEQEFTTPEMRERGESADLVTEMAGYALDMGRLGAGASARMPGGFGAFVTRALWAALKTADDSVPSYAAWARGAGTANLVDVFSELMTGYYPAFFRASDADGREPAEEGPQA